VAFFDSADGTRLAYHRTGDGRPLICLPGGPMQAAAYLGDLGGLSARLPLALLDPRGTGESDAPSDPSTYRCDRQVDDVDALRRHLGLDRIDLAAHSAGAAIAVLYAARYPERVSRLILIAPSSRVVGVDVADQDRREVTEAHRGQPWYPEAIAAFGRVWAGTATAADWAGITPFTYVRWDAETRAHAARADTERNAEAAAVYYESGAFDPAEVRAALSGLRAPVLLIGGEYDVALPPKSAAEYAGLFPRAGLSVQPGGAHYPWLVDAAAFVRTVTDFML
jgi:pimeloyl-ACP methyl ester carboxylesterase